MAHRVIGPASDSADRPSRSASLDEVLTVIAWDDIAEQLVGIYGAVKGEKAWPPLALFRALLLSIWYDLSDDRHRLQSQACRAPARARVRLRGKQRASAVQQKEANQPINQPNGSHRRAKPTGKDDHPTRAQVS